MSLDSAISRFRRRQRDLFRDVAKVERPSTSGTIDGDGTYTPGASTVVESAVSCLLRAFTWEGTSVEAGGSEVRLRRVRAKFPVDTDVRYGDIITPTASIYDSSLVGVYFRVTDSFRDGWQIARVAIMEEVTT